MVVKIVDTGARQQLAMEGPRDAEAAEADLALHTKLAMHERHVAMRLTEAGVPGLAPLLRDVQRRGQGTSWVFLLVARWVGMGNSMGSEGSTGNFCLSIMGLRGSWSTCFVCSGALAVASTLHESLTMLVSARLPLLVTALLPPAAGLTAALSPFWTSCGGVAARGPVLTRSCCVCWRACARLHR